MKTVQINPKKLASVSNSLSLVKSIAGQNLERCEMLSVQHEVENQYLPLQNNDLSGVFQRYKAAKDLFVKSMSRTSLNCYQCCKVHHSECPHFLSIPNETATRQTKTRMYLGPTMSLILGHCGRIQ